MSGSDLSFEEVFAYCYNNLSKENCPEIDNDDVIFDFKVASKYIWNNDQKVFINLDQEIVNSKDPVQSTSLWGEPIEGSFYQVKTVEFYHIAPHKIFESYNMELFRVTRKGAVFCTGIMQKYSDLLEVCEERQEFFFIVYNEEASIPYGVFQGVASIDYSDLPRQDIRDTFYMYFTSDNSNKQLPYFETKNGGLIHKLEPPHSRILNGSPYRLVLKPVNKLFAHALVQFGELRDIEKIHDKNLLQYAPQKITEDTSLSSSYSDYFIFIPRQLIK